jgi:hypothetical protein
MKQEYKTSYTQEDDYWASSMPADRATYDAIKTNTYNL